MVAALLESHGILSASDITASARAGHAASITLVERSARIVGETVASLVNRFNPSVVVLGGSIAGVGELFLATVRETVYGRSTPLATRDLRIVPAGNHHTGGVSGATALLGLQLFGDALTSWVGSGTPLAGYHALY